VTPLTFATLCRHRAFTDKDFWQACHGRPLHIQLGEWAEVFVIAPLTKNFLMVQAPGFIRGINPKSKIENPQAPAFIRGVNLKSKI
jgi:phosphopantothenoylcysteine synthetase/decarboxylase